MSSDPAEKTAKPGRSAWPLVVVILAMLLVGAGVWMFHRTTAMPAATLEKGRELTREIGGQAISVARAFREGMIRTEFFSRAAELGGTNRLQVATLKQHETFRREEGGHTMWRLIPVPKIVVQAQAPVEYSYFVELKGPWEFRQQERQVAVLAPPLEANTPALDVSALTFHTLEGSLWPVQGPVRERLRETVTRSLQKRADENEPLVREVSRRAIKTFAEDWLAGRFTDGGEYRVEVFFPDETAPWPAEASRP